MLETAKVPVGVRLRRTPEPVAVELISLSSDIDALAAPPVPFRHSEVEELLRPADESVCSQARFPPQL